MARRRHTAEEIIGKLREAEVLLAQGRPVAEVCKGLGVTEQSYYLYGRLSRCKATLVEAAWSVANIYPASPLWLGAPKWGIRSRMPL